MPKVSVLQFNNYSVEELAFKIAPIDNEQQEFQVHPCFNTSLIDMGDNNYNMRLSVEVPSTEDFPMPFELRVAIVGHFTYVDENEDSPPDYKTEILKKNTLSILFPFLRQIVATLTSTANVPTLMLPIMNFNDFPSIE
ncbi:MAG: protein-export chaperone SecB [Ruminiclostridium sp.]|nr:protein-export chaperone SecB [Ruminiclostridium sp.]